MSEDLLHKVDVRSISEPVLEVLRDLVGEAVRSALADRGLAQPAGALKPREAARYIGRSRSRLYELLEHDPLIQAASFKQGKSRLFLRENLDRWLQAQQLLLAASGSEGRLNDPYCERPDREDTTSTGAQQAPLTVACRLNQTE